jgi:hypothetical protein
LQQVETSYDSISYAAPIGPVIVSIKRNEGSDGVTNKALGLGIGDAGTAAPHNTQLAAYYAGGPLTLLGVYRTYDNQLRGDLSTPQGIKDTMAGTKDYVYNAQGAYDFGVAKVGLGYQFARGSNGTQITDAELAVSVPVGAWTFGASYATAYATNVPATPGWNIKNYEGSQTGTSIGARYNFSKRTNITLKYASWTYSGYAQYEADYAAAVAARQLLPTYGGAGLGYGTANETWLCIDHNF